MKQLRYAAVISLLALISKAGEDVKQFSTIIDKPESEYTIDVGGTIDPENVEIVVENIGTLRS